MVWCSEVKFEGLLQSNIIGPFNDDACSTSFHIEHTIYIKIPPIWSSLDIASKLY